MPPQESDRTIVVKLCNCPNNATPVGPIIAATILTLTNPVNIFTKVDIDVRVKTFTISALVTCLQKERNLCVSIPIGSPNQQHLLYLPLPIPDSSVNLTLHCVFAQ